MNHRYPDFPGHIGTTVAESRPHWVQPGEKPATPHILLVVLDDTGWADFGCFGSEIATPAIDKLAAEGLRYNNFHVTPLCSPTRACLMTGRNHHAVGMRFLADIDTGFPNSRGRIDPHVPMLPALLRDQGYSTYMVGKWHLAPRHELTPAGPFRDWPLGRGFDKFYGFLDGVTDHYAPDLVQDNQQVDPPARDDYHLSEDLVDRALRFLGDHASFTAERPFFMQLAFGATHAPFQAPRDYILPYVKVFEKGWDATRANRLARQKAMGLVPPDAELAERNPGVPAWDSLNADEKLLYTHLQAAYAGFLEHADAQLGRLLAGLTSMGLREDTVVIVLSDNGASREGGRDGAVDINGPYSGHRQSVAEQLASIDLIGGPMGPAHYPEGWAMAGNTPFRRYKQFVDLGGLRSPMVVSWPKGITPEVAGQVRSQFVHAVDIAPTLLSMVAAEAAPTFDGRSFAPTFADAAAPTARHAQYWETLGHRAIWHDGWKAVTEHVAGVPFDEDDWRLYDTRTDFSEVHNLAKDKPDVLAGLIERWWAEARHNGVLPLDDRSLVELIRLRTPLGMINRREIVLRPGQSTVPFATRITGSDRSMRVQVQLRGRGGSEQGVLLSSGSAIGGYVLYVLNERLHFEHLCLAQRTVCVAEAPMPRGDAEIGFHLIRGEGRTAALELFHGQQCVARAHIAHTSVHLSFFGLAVCSDPVSQVGSLYQGAFGYPEPGVEAVRILFEQVASPAVSAAVIEATE